MSKMSEDIWYAGSDARPPMLDRTDFESWQQRIRLYCLGKDNGENIMKSITEGPFQMGTFIQTPAEDAEETEGALQLGPERARVFTDLSAKEKERYKADIRATNILLQGITIIDEFEAFRQIKGETIHAFNSSRVVNHSKHISLNRTIKSELPQTQRTMHTVQEVVVQDARGIGHIARECPHLASQGFQTTFKECRLLMNAHKNGVVLDEEQLLFLTGEQVTNFDDDVFEADQYDAFDSDVDEAPTTQTMFMDCPPDYSKENLRATFAPQRNLTPEQIFWSKDNNTRKKAETLAPKPISALTKYVIGTCPKEFTERDSKAPSIPLTRKKQVTFNNNTQKHGVHQKVQQSNVQVIPSTGVSSSTRACGSKPRSNTKNNRILPAKSVNNKKVEDHPRTNKSVWTKVNRVDSGISSKRVVINSNSESVCKTCNKCLNSASHEMCVVNILNSVNATPTVKIVLNKGKQIWKPKGKLSDNSLNKTKQIWQPKGKLSDNSLNKTKQVWKATGKLFANVGYQWRPTGKKFTSGKLNCGYQWRPTGKKFALGELCPLTRIPVTCCSKLDLEEEMAPVRISSGPEPKMMFGQNSSSLVLHQMMSAQISSGLAPQCLKMFELSSSSLGLHCQKTFKQISSNLVSQMSQRRLLASLQAPPPRSFKERKIRKGNLLLDLQKNPIFRISVDIRQSTNFVRAFTTSTNVPSIYIQLFWNSLTHDVKTGVYSFQVNEHWLTLSADLLRKALNVTPADSAHPFESPPAGKTDITFTRRRVPLNWLMKMKFNRLLNLIWMIMSTIYNKVGLNSEQSHVALAGSNPEHMHDVFLATNYPKVHESLKHTTKEHVHLENPPSSSRSLSSLKNHEDFMELQPGSHLKERLSSYRQLFLAMALLIENGSSIKGRVLFKFNVWVPIGKCNPVLERQKKLRNQIFSALTASADVPIGYSFPMICPETGGIYTRDNPLVSTEVLSVANAQPFQPFRVSLKETLSHLSRRLNMQSTVSRTPRQISIYLVCHTLWKKVILEFLRIILVILPDVPSDHKDFSIEDGNPAGAYIKQDLGSFKDGDGGGDSSLPAQALACLPIASAAPSSEDVVYLSHGDVNPLADLVSIFPTKGSSLASSMNVFMEISSSSSEEISSSSQ
ncbi:hypothetical protein Tco_0278084 [Tanacetum coccineum]